ncbi:hypothetical protein FRC01_013577, partial [Tulasnella sp. 417]
MTAPRDPVSQTTRYLLLPIGLYVYAYVVGFRDYGGGEPKFNVRNYGVGLFNFAAALKLLEMTFSRTPPQRIIASAPPKGSPNGDTQAHEVYTQNVAAKPNGPESTATKGTMREVIEYLCDPRLLHYDIRMAQNSHDLETRETAN